MEVAGWAGFLMALVSLLGTTLAAINARKLARDKAEFERLAAKDKQDFELKVMEIQEHSRMKDAELAEMRRELASCREQHEQSERDRDHLRHRIAGLEQQIGAIAGS